MSYKDYYKKASQQKQVGEGVGLPEVNRFSDVRAVDKRRHDVLDYLLIGHDSVEIAEFLGVSEATVEEDIKRIAEIGFESRNEDLDSVRDEMMRVYRTAIREAHRSYRRSVGYEVTETEEVSEDEEGLRTEKRKTVKKENHGDAKHLKVMVDAAKEVGKVTGAQKHKEIEAVQNVNTKEVHILSPNRSKLPSDFDKWNAPPEDIDDAEIIDED